MDAREIEKALTRYLKTTALNRVAAANALVPNIAGMRIFDDPIVGVCEAGDECLHSYRDNNEANLHMLMPGDWLSDARSVVSVFLPFTERVRASNRGAGAVSHEWLHGRIEGQKCVAGLAKHLAEWLGDTVIPFLDPRFKLERIEGADPTRSFIVNWSERHVAYAAGLGTFSMPGGLITKKGAAGRLLSVVTACEAAPTPRAYTDIYEYCIRCGKCIDRCPARAITKDMRKNALRCSAQLDIPKEKFAPYYGCGKCQTAVPCEHTAPNALRREAAERDIDTQAK
jgi:epoxyqueuosine reductase QueG